MTVSYITLFVSLLVGLVALFFAGGSGFSMARHDDETGRILLVVAVAALLFCIALAFIAGRMI